jgi:hypothetical protein
VFPALDWLAQLTTRTPNRREHMVRYYGFYSILIFKNDKCASLSFCSHNAHIKRVVYARWSYLASLFHSYFSFVCCYNKIKAKKTVIISGIKVVFFKLKIFLKELQCLA